MDQTLHSRDTVADTTMALCRVDSKSAISFELEGGEPAGASIGISMCLDGIEVCSRSDDNLVKTGLDVRKKRRKC